MDLATLFVRFKADTSDVNSKVKQLESNTKKSGDNIAKTLASAFSAAVIGEGIKKSIDAASDLNETVSKTKVIFGDASTAIEKQGDDAAKAMGLSKQAYLDAASGLKGLLDNLGLTSDKSVEWSQKLVQLGSDLGSFFNKDPAEAITAIQAALRGESEPIRAFNVNISDAALKIEAMKQGLYDGVGALDANARANAALALIVQQTTTAQGDFARTSDGAANSQRIAKAEATDAAASFGQVLLPVYTQVVQVVGNLAKVFGDLPGPVQTVIIALVGLVAIAGPLGSLIEVVGGLKEALIALSGSPATLAFLGLAAAAIGVYAALKLFGDETDHAAERAKKFYGEVKTGVDTIDLQKVAFDDAATAARDYADAAYSDADKKLRDTITGNKKYVEALQQLGLTLDDVTKVNRGGTEAQNVLTTARERALKVARDLTGIQDLESTSSEATTRAWQKMTAEQRRSVDAALGQVRSIDQLVTLLQNQTTASYDSAEAAANLAKVGDDQAYVYLKTTGQLNLLTAAEQSTAESHLDLANASDESTAASLSQAAAVNDLGLSLDVSTRAAGSAKDATLDFAVAQDQAKARAAANATATGKLKDALTKETSATDKARAAADDFGKALDEVFGSALDLEDANRALAEGFDKVAQSIKDNGNTLDINTEKGRNNRASIEDQVKTINKKIEADIASGVSIADATAAGELYRQHLIDTSGSTDEARAAAEDYINQLGLTPENISTAVQLTHDEEVKGRLQTLLDQLGDIDAGAAAKIQAEIDQGKFDEAEADLNKLARDRPVRFVPSGGFTSGNVAGPRSGNSAFGRFVRGGSHFFTDTGERPGAGGDEVILPLGDPARMRQLAASNNVGSRILDALAGSGAAAGDGGSIASSGSTSSATSMTGLHVEHLEIHDDTSAQSLAQIVMFMMAGV